MINYSKTFFKTLEQGSYASALIVLKALFSFYVPKSIIDIGCGTGSWLKAARDLGVHDIFGVDGDYVSTDMLLIDEDSFERADLEQEFIPRRRYECAISMEVAEHLDPKAAPSFVKTLVNCAPVVVFSAAIPFQGGTHHLNEQWPSYWAELFSDLGYVPLDILRPKIVNSPEVEFYYKQNVVVYVDKTQLRLLHGVPHPRSETNFRYLDKFSTQINGLPLMPYFLYWLKLLVIFPSFLRRLFNRV